MSIINREENASTISVSLDNGGTLLNVPPGCMCILRTPADVPRSQVPVVLVEHDKDTGSRRTIALDMVMNHTYEFTGSWRPPYLESHVVSMEHKKREQELTQLRDKVRDLQDRIDMRRTTGQFFAQPPEELRRNARLAMPNLDGARMNIALVGPSGMGKSSLVNALLAACGRRYAKKSKTPMITTTKIESDQMDLAPVSTATECTQEVHRYDLAGTDMSIWDLPGGGTPRHPTDTFVTDKQLAAFDMQIMVMEGRLTDFHAATIYAALRKFQNQLIIAVCVKGDTLVTQEVMNSNCKKPRAQAFEDVHQVLLQNVKEASQGQIKRVFLLSSWALAHNEDQDTGLGFRDQAMHESVFLDFLDSEARLWKDTCTLTEAATNAKHALDSLA